MKKRVISLLLAAVMCLILSAPAFALTVYSETDVVYSQAELEAIQDYNRTIEAYMKVREKVRAGGQKLLPIACIEQVDGSHCGPACAVMATKYLGLKTSDGRDYTQYTIENVIGYTGDNGSSSGLIADGMNDLLGETIYQLVNTGKDTSKPKASLWGSLVAGIDQNYPMFINVKKMPNYDEPVKVGHFILGIGYYWAMTGATSNSKVTYNDPNRKKNYVGQHTITIEEMVEACESNVGNFVRAAV